MTIQYRTRVDPFPPAVLEAIARALGDTERGLTGSEIAHRLAECEVPDVDPTNTKWKRLFNAMAAFQVEHQVGNHVVKLIQLALSPVHFVDDPLRHRERCQAINTCLAFVGMNIAEDGRVRRVPVAGNLDDALRRSNRLKAELRRRNVHEEVIRFCDAEIIAENAFHAVFEAMKSITSRIRALSGLSGDGAELVDQAFAFNATREPLVAINALHTETQRGEQRGFATLLKGLYGTFRNPLGHEAKIEWDMSDEDALDILSIVSLVHRKLQKATAAARP